MGIVIHRNLTAPETIVKANNERKVIAPNSHWNRLLLEEDGKSGFKPLPPEIRQGNGETTYHTGTAYVFRTRYYVPLGKEVVHEFMHNDKPKQLIYLPDKSHQDLCDVMLLCDQGFAEGKNLVDLLNISTGKPISRLDDAREIQLKFNGQIRLFKPENLRSGAFEGNKDTQVWFPLEDINIRGDFWLGLIMRDVYQDTDYAGDVSRCRGQVNFTENDLNERRGALFLDSERKQ